MSPYPAPLAQLITALKTFPGVGGKTAERFAFHLLSSQDDQLDTLSQSIATCKKRIKNCDRCGCLLSETTCSLCDPENRSSHALCIVAHAKDVFAIEGTREYTGMYHVLGGVLSPLEGKGPEQLRLSSLKERVAKEAVRELIIAIDSTLEGDATTLYLKQELSRPGLTISRLAFGIPIGSSLDYVDGGTLAQSFSGRREV